MSGAALDATALLAFLRSEAGADVVAKHLRGGIISAVNLTEVFEHALRREHGIGKVRALLQNWSVKVVEHNAELAEVAARFKEECRDADLSFADRACLALANQRGIPVVTSDPKWKELPIGVEVIGIRG